MSGLTDLNQLLKQMNPSLCEQEFVFICHTHAQLSTEIEQYAIATVIEQEGRTLVVPKHVADQYGKCYTAVFRKITLQVQSSLEAVGLTAAVANRLLQHGIAANVIAGFHHDHVFVLSSKATAAMLALQDLSSDVEENQP